MFHRIFKWVMLISGLLTCTMLYALFAPEASLRSTFGEPLSGPVAQIVVRNWGALIGLMGLMLIHGAFNESARRVALLVAGTSKVVFIALALTYGPQIPQAQLRTPVVVDSLMVLLFAIYLLSSRPKAAT